MLVFDGVELSEEHAELLGLEPGASGVEARAAIAEVLDWLAGLGHGDDDPGDGPDPDDGERRVLPFRRAA